MPDMLVGGGKEQTSGKKKLAPDAEDNTHTHPTHPQREESEN